MSDLKYNVLAEELPTGAENHEADNVANSSISRLLYTIIFALGRGIGIITHFCFNLLGMRRCIFACCSITPHSPDSEGSDKESKQEEDTDIEVANNMQRALLRNSSLRTNKQTLQPPAEAANACLKICEGFRMAASDDGESSPKKPRLRNDDGAGDSPSVLSLEDVEGCMHYRTEEIHGEPGSPNMNRADRKNKCKTELKYTDTKEPIFQEEIRSTTVEEIINTLEKWKLHDVQTNELVTNNSASKPEMGPKDAKDTNPFKQRPKSRTPDASDQLRDPLTNVQTNKSEKSEFNSLEERNIDLARKVPNIGDSEFDYELGGFVGSDLTDDAFEKDWKIDKKVETDQMFEYMEMAPPSAVLTKCRKFIRHYQQRVSPPDGRIIVIFLKKLNLFVLVKRQTNALLGASETEALAMDKLFILKNKLYNEIYLIHRARYGSFKQFMDTKEQQMFHEFRTAFFDYRKRKTARMMEESVKNGGHHVDSRRVTLQKENMFVHTEHTILMPKVSKSELDLRNSEVPLACNNQKQTDELPADKSYVKELLHGVESDPTTEDQSATQEQTPKKKESGRERRKRRKAKKIYNLLQENMAEAESTLGKPNDSQENILPVRENFFKGKDPATGNAVPDVIPTNSRRINFEAFQHDQATCKICNTNRQIGIGRFNDFLARGLIAQEILGMLRGGIPVSHPIPEKEVLQRAFGHHQISQVDILRIVVDGDMDGVQPPNARTTGTSCTVTVIGNGMSSDIESDRNSSGDEDNQKKAEKASRLWDCFGTPIVKPTDPNRRRWRSAARSQLPDPLTSLPVKSADDSTIDSCFTNPLLPPADVDEVENTNNRRRRRLRTRTKSFPDPRRLDSLPEVDASKSEVPYHFIPDGAVFDYTRLEVEPSHGDRPNKKKLEECVREKVKTKGEPNKHLQKQTTSKYGCEYEADSADSLRSSIGGDGDIKDETECELILEVPEVVKDEPPPLLATAMPQTIDDREYNMVPEVIIRKDEDTRLKDVEDKYTLSTTPKKDKQKKRRERKSKGKTVTLDFF